jgi:hypothetical protein
MLQPEMAIIRYLIFSFYKETAVFTIIVINNILLSAYHVCVCVCVSAKYNNILVMFSIVYSNYV